MCKHLEVHKIVLGFPTGTGDYLRTVNKKPAWVLILIGLRPAFQVADSMVHRSTRKRRKNMSASTNRSAASIAGNLATALFGVIIVLQLLLAAGILPVSMAWGGQQSTLTSVNS
jgi:hypothetical protein